MIFGAGPIYEASASVEKIDEDTLEVSSASGGQNFSFTSYAEGDIFAVVAMSTTGGTPGVDDGGWTVEDSTDDDVRIWTRTLGASDNPNTYGFSSLQDGFAASYTVFYGWIIRGGTTTAANVASGTSSPQTASVSGYSLPAVAVGVGAHLTSGSNISVSSDFNDTVTSTANYPAAIGGDHTQTATSESLAASSTASKKELRSALLVISP